MDRILQTIQLYLYKFSLLKTGNKLMDFRLKYTFKGEI